MIPKIKILDNIFPHGTSIGSGDLKIYPTRFSWHRGEGLTQNGNILDDIVFITETSFNQVEALPHKIKIGWITEPPTTDDWLYGGKIYEEIRKPENYNKFTIIITYIKELLDISPKFVFHPSAGCWIYPDAWQVYPKTKYISIIASKKTTTDGHRLRHEVIKRFGQYIDGIYGHGYKFIDSKLEGLKDYRYQIVIENERNPLFFSEKLIDCFATGTIPIYWGAQEIDTFFDKKGIIIFNDANHLQEIFIAHPYLLSAEQYQHKIKEVNKNLNLAKQYAIVEDWIWDNVINKYILNL